MPMKVREVIRLLEQNNLSKKSKCFVAAALQTHRRSSAFIGGGTLLRTARRMQNFTEELLPAPSPFLALRRRRETQRMIVSLNRE